ncbi:MAG: hypothetical protein GXY61_03255 [Lentisphaerae bacterium]|nr:hypothetical protein [Lentisphaerota bacterium]
MNRYKQSMRWSLLSLAVLPQAHAIDAVNVAIGFEAAEGYTVGEKPIDPWLCMGGNSTTSETVRVSSMQVHSGSQSLAITPDSSDYAVYPVLVQSNQTARFTVWIRPASHQYNEVMGSVSVFELAPNDYWYASCGARFEANIFAEPEDGDNLYNLTFVDGYTARHVGDFTPETWYPVACDITTSQIIFTVTIDTGTYTNAFPRHEGYKVTEIQLAGRQFMVDPEYLSQDRQIVYFDDFMYTPPVAPVTLSILSDHGNPVPAVGEHPYYAGNVVTCSVDSVTQSLTNYSAGGWTASGHTPSSGSGNQATLNLTDNTVLTWLWQTNYWLEAVTSGQGQVVGGDVWAAKDSQIGLTAVPETGWLFMGWSGDATGTNNVTLLMDEPKSVTAVFSDDADGDGLTNTDETEYGSDPWETDTDEDGFDDKLEVDHDWNPIISDQWAVDYIRENAADFDLSTSNSVIDIAVGQMLLETTNGMATLYLQLEQSDDLESWTNAGEAVIWEIPNDSPTQFFRVRSEK